MNRRELRTHISQPYEDNDIILHFAGDIHCTRHSEIQFHRNPGFEICLIPSGKGLFKIDELTYPVENDRMFFTKAPQIHGGWPAVENPFRIQYVCLEVKKGIHCTDPLWRKLHGQMEAISHPVCQDQEALMDVHHRLMSELTHAGPLHSGLIRILLLQYVMLTIRNYCHSRTGKNDSTHEVISHDSSSPPVITLTESTQPRGLATGVIRYIDTHLDRKLHLPEIASALHVSVSTLSRRFRRETGFSVMEYCHLARLEMGKKWLMTKNDTISQIAHALHYGSIHHFSNAFKSMYGISPTQFRRREQRAGDDLNMQIPASSLQRQTGKRRI